MVVVYVGSAVYLFFQYALYVLWFLHFSDSVKTLCSITLHGIVVVVVVVVPYNAVTDDVWVCATVHLQKHAGSVTVCSKFTSLVLDHFNVIKGNWRGGKNCLSLKFTFQIF